MGNAPADDAPEDLEELERSAELVRGIERLNTTRRSFLQTVAAGVAAAAASAPAAASALSWEEFLQQHYTRLDDAEKRAIFARLEAETLRRTGVRVNINDPPPLAGVEFAYALNLTYCVGCRRCEYACVQENNTSRAPPIHYIKVLEMEKGSFEVLHASSEYEGAVPARSKFYMPVQCHQCRRAPCVRACPVRATWQEPEGVTVIDYNWCIGCHYCEAACPYGARRFNFREPVIRPSEINPDQGYLTNRIRPIGVMEKCTFCLHRTRRGQYPACLEVCPTGSRKFGNILDPNSEVRRIIETKRVYIFKEEVGTNPRFYYYFD